MNGDDICEIVKTLEGIDFNNGRPHMVVSKTTKGFGVSYMENVAKWHHGVPNEEQYETALREIDERLKEYQK